ncbi:MAG TPA: hypothetical protein DCG54_13630 [Anaerolineae bacterium]|nr:hypothetical protein [Anaerolineae bacterium]
MGKKRKLKTTNITSSAQINIWFAMATKSMQIKDWDGVIEICKQILLHLPKKSNDRADALSYLTQVATLVYWIKQSMRNLVKFRLLKPKPNRRIAWTLKL